MPYRRRQPAADDVETQPDGTHTRHMLHEYNAMQGEDEDQLRAPKRSRRTYLSNQFLSKLHSNP